MHLACLAEEHRGDRTRDCEPQRPWSM